MITGITMMITSVMKNSESPFGEPEHACRRDCTAGGSGRGKRGAQEAKVVAAAPSDE